MSICNRRKSALYFVVFLFWVISQASTLDEANNYYTSGELLKAIASYKKAAKSGENKAICYFNCGNAYFQLDSLPQSIVFYQAAIIYAPEFFRSYLNLAISYYSLEDYAQCIATMQRGLALQPQDDKALLLLAAAYQKLHAYAEAAVTFESLTKTNPELEEPFIALGEIYRELGDLPEAIRWLSQSSQGSKNAAYVNRLIADAYVDLADYGKAVYYLQKAIEIDPTDRWSFYRIVELHTKMGNDLVAIRTAEDALVNFPRFGELALTAGNIAFKLQQYDKAERFYLKAKECGSTGAMTGLQNIRIIQLEKQQESTL